MISYRGFGPAEAFENAAKDKTWTRRERLALRAVARGLRNVHYNNLLMADMIDGVKWDGTEEQLRKPEAYSKRWSSGRIYGIEGHRIRFYVHESDGGCWNIGRVMKNAAARQ